MTTVSRPADQMEPFGMSEEGEQQGPALLKALPSKAAKAVGLSHDELPAGTGKRAELLQQKQQQGQRDLPSADVSAEQLQQVEQQKAQQASAPDVAAPATPQRDTTTAPALSAATAKSPPATAAQRATGGAPPAAHSSRPGPTPAAASGQGGSKPAAAAAPAGQQQKGGKQGSYATAAGGGGKATAAAAAAPAAAPAPAAEQQESVGAEEEGEYEDEYYEEGDQEEEEGAEDNAARREGHMHTVDFTKAKVGPELEPDRPSDFYTTCESKGQEPLSSVKLQMTGEATDADVCDICECVPCQCGKISKSYPFEMNAQEQKRSGKPHLNNSRKSLENARNNHPQKDYKMHAKPYREDKSRIGQRVGDHAGFLGKHEFDHDQKQGKMREGLAAAQAKKAEQQRQMGLPYTQELSAPGGPKEAKAKEAEEETEGQGTAMSPGGGHKAGHAHSSYTGGRPLEAPGDDVGNIRISSGKHNKPHALG